MKVVQLGCYFKDVGEAVKSDVKLNKIVVNHKADEYICDGLNYKGKDVIVVGGGNSGFDESLCLISLGVNEVIIVEELEACIADRKTQHRAFSTGKISAKTCRKVVKGELCGKKAKITLEDVKSGEKEEIVTNGMFVFIGQIPNTGNLKGIAALDDNGYIRVYENMRTDFNGVFAAGDVVVKKYRQLTTAMSDGTIAALEASKYIRENF